MPAYAGFYFNKEVKYEDPEATARQFIPENRPRLEAVRSAFAGLRSSTPRPPKARSRRLPRALGVKVGLLVYPTRLALTGAASGSQPVPLDRGGLGKEDVLRRIDPCCRSGVSATGSI